MIDIRKLPNLTIAQKDFVQQFYAAFNWDSPGSNHHIENVEPLLYEGVLAASEFLIYEAGTLYLCFSFDGSYNGTVYGVNYNLSFYNEANVVNFFSHNMSITYDSVAPSIRYSGNNLRLKNFYFSRILNAANVYSHIKFIGYRITLD